MEKTPQPKITHCEDCGKLYESNAGDMLCTNCRRSRMSRDDVFHEAVERLAKELEIHQGLSSEDSLLLPPQPPKCLRCSKHTQLDDSEFCLACQIEIVHDLGSAAYDLFGSIGTDPVKPKGMRELLSEKRARTASSHIRLSAPKQK